jgi:hypothetical protein
MRTPTAARCKRTLTRRLSAFWLQQANLIQVSVNLLHNASTQLVVGARAADCDVTAALNVSFGPNEGAIEKDVIDLFLTLTKKELNSTLCGGIAKLVSNNNNNKTPTSFFHASSSTRVAVVMCVLARVLRERVACPLTTTATATAAPPSSDPLLAKVETKLGGGINNLSIALAPWMAPISPQAPAEVTHPEDVLDLRESPVVQFMSYLASTGLGKGTISTNAFLFLFVIYQAQEICIQKFI